MGLLSHHKDDFEEKQNRIVLNLCPGDAVEVRGEEEIRRTLDSDGSLDGLPFMHEMATYCGRRFKVLTRVDRTVVEGIGNRRMRNTVILESATCDGQAHGDCQRTCRILWKEDWLKRVNGRTLSSSIDFSGGSLKVENGNRSGGVTFCQLTSLPEASRRLPISFEDIVRQYVCNRNFARSGLPRSVCDFWFWLNFRVQRFLGRKRYGALHGRLTRTPSLSLTLQPGEWVQVKSREEIIATLDTRGRNRGLHLTHEMLKYCGGRYKVKRRVERMVSERSGQIRNVSDTVILQGVTCDGSDNRGCPRRCYCLWREIWLKKV